MSLVIAFEGCDGSGKTTLLQLVSDELRSLGVQAAVVGKNDVEETALITQLIQSQKLSFSPGAEALLKLARERERLLAASRSRVSLLDRGLVSITSVLAAQELAIAPMESLLQECRTMAGDYSTVLCETPFEHAWKRMNDRALSTGATLSKKEARGPEFNRRVHAEILQACETGRISGPVFRVDTWNLTPAVSTKLVVDHVLDRLGVGVSGAVDPVIA